MNESREFSGFSEAQAAAQPTVNETGGNVLAEASGAYSEGRNTGGRQGSNALGNEEQGGVDQMG